ncbi:AraC family transcriptional regulator [Paenibacillus thiaminolyticus]|uniref:AraC family transcriptional regulator n=1 Tax=Paenibacillus thiaminolyticus TaxID=49283 RepID=UPI0021757D24|nr:AraC family transcriptional regulator [Paenibacillus thiaminolyticus]
MDTTDAYETNFYQSDIFNISRERKIRSSMPSRHYHDAYEIFYLVSGKLSYFVGDKTYHLMSGMLLFINVNEIHKLVNSSGPVFERITLQFKRAFITDLLPKEGEFDVFSAFQADTNLLRLDGSDQSTVEGLFDRMVHESLSQPPGYAYYVTILLIELLIYLKRKADSSQHQHGACPQQIHPKIIAIINFINENYSRRITLDSISRQFYISPSYLCKMFKDSTGFTLIEYVNNVRIKEARLLLRDTDAKMGDIAERVGFESLTHFGRIFKELTGCSPLKYHHISVRTGPERELLHPPSHLRPEPDYAKKPPLTIVKEAAFFGSA